MNNLLPDFSIEEFDKNIKGMIESFSSEHYLFVLDQNFECSCLNDLSKQPNRQCKKCLGLGYKARLFKKNIAVFEKSLSLSDSSSSNLSKGSMENKVIYCNFTDPILKSGDIIIVDGNIFEVYSSNTFSHFNNRKTYQKILAAYMKNQGNVNRSIKSFIKELEKNNEK